MLVGLGDAASWHGAVCGRDVTARAARYAALVKRLLAIALLVAACGGTVGPTTSAATTTPSAAAAVDTMAPTPAPTPTATPTAAPIPSPTPEPTGSTSVTNQWLRPWQSDSFAEADVVVEVTNTGGTWVRLQPGQSDYTILGASGNVLTTSSFTYAYPTYLGPGQVGYLAQDVVTSDAKAKDMKSLEVNAYFVEVTQDQAVTFTVSKVTNRPAQYTFEGPTTTGRLTNESDTTVSQGNVGAFYFDATGNCLGFSSTNLIENVAPHQTKSFETVGGAPYMKLSAIKKTVVIATTSDY